MLGSPDLPWNLTLELETSAGVVGAGESGARCHQCVCEWAAPVAVPDAQDRDREVGALLRRVPMDDRALICPQRQTGKLVAVRKREIGTFACEKSGSPVREAARDA